MTLKIGIAGTGNLARANYMPCLSGEKDVELGYYNPHPEQGGVRCVRGRTFPSPEDLVAWEPDTILALTKENDRCEAASAFLERIGGHLRQR